MDFQKIINDVKGILGNVAKSAAADEEKIKKAIDERAKQVTPEMVKREAESMSKQKDNDSKEQPVYTQGVDIVHTEHKNGKWGNYSKEKTIDSLRTGEDVRLPGAYGNGKTVNGGTVGSRYLGAGIGDYTNPNYFSEFTEVSDKYSPLSVRIEGMWQPGNTSSWSTVGDMTVYYDDKGAISEIDLDGDFVLPTGAKYKKGKIWGRANLSDFFKNFKLDDYNYSASTKTPVNGVNRGINFGSDYDRYMPTNIFGSKGVLSGAPPLKLNQKTLDVQYGGMDNSQWRDYWHGVSEQSKK